MPATEVKRVSANISLPEDMMGRLDGEAEERDISKSKIIERALPMLFEKWDTMKAAEVSAERAAAKAASSAPTS